MGRFGSSLSAKVLLYVLLFLLAVLLQSSLLASPLSRAVPSLLTPLLLSLALWEEKPGLVLGLSFLAGLLLDLVSSTPLGVYTLTFLLLSAVTLALQRIFFSLRFSLWLVLVLVFDFLARLLSTALILLSTGKEIPFSLFLDNLSLGLLYTALCAVPLYPLCRLLRPKRPSERFQVL
ncbi:MAG: rod shape-determining protein MreD [Coprothermobacterota bacterium]|nr:rod shape-determining protein MreD [Coprothermobacterota bacterium]